VNGRRQPVTLKPIPLSQPGTYALKREWPAEGNWVVAVTTAYLQAGTSSLIPMGEAGFERQAVKYFNRPFTRHELEALLHSESGK
jgi:hypothetical protein